MDLVGRRGPISGGLFLGGVMLILMTFSSSVYPALCIYVIVLSLSGSPAETAPLLNDYIYPKSFSLGQMYISFMQYLGTTTATSLTIAL